VGEHKCAAILAPKHLKLEKMWNGGQLEKIRQTINNFSFHSIPEVQNCGDEMTYFVFVG